MSDRSLEHRLLDLQYQLDSTEAVKNQAYAERNKVLSLTARMAQKLGLNVGLGKDESPDADPDYYLILFIDLPSGQVSWHLRNDEVKPMFGFLPFYGTPWDGHSTEEKYQRVLEPGL